MLETLARARLRSGSNADSLRERKFSQKDKKRHTAGRTRAWMGSGRPGDGGGSQISFLGGSNSHIAAKISGVAYERL